MVTGQVGTVAGASAGFSLLERDLELELISDTIAAAGEGAGRMLILEGPPGVGKSRLLAEATERAQAAGLRPLQARASELEREFPFGLAMQLFEGPLNAASELELERERLGAGAASHALAAITPTGSPAPPSSATGFAQLHGLYWLTANLAERMPLLLLVDDLQWADTASLRYLAYLAMRLADLPVAVVGARREAEIAELDDVAESLQRIPGVSRGSVRPLSSSACAALVRERRPEAAPEFASECARLAGGNPLLLRELIEEIALRGLGTGAEDSALLGRTVPASVSELALARIAGLGPEATRIARAVAVLGDATPLWQAARLAELDLDQAATSVDRLAVVDVLEQGEAPAFVHPLVRLAVYGAISPSERSRAHQRAAELLVEAGETSLRVASHLLNTHVGGDPSKVPILRQAANDSAAKGAPEAAIALLQRALREGPDPADRAELLLALGSAASAAGSPEAVAYLRDAIEASGAPVMRANASLALGRALFLRGELVAAAAAFERGLGERPDHDLCMRLEAEYCQVATLVPPLVAGVPARLEAAIGSIGDGPLTGGERALLATAALGASIACQPHEVAHGLARRAAGERGELVDQETCDGNAVYSVTGVFAYTEDFEAGIEVVNQAIADARRRSSVLGFATASFVRSWYMLLSGRLGDALADTEVAIDARRFGWHQYLPAAYGIHVMAQVERGDLDGAAARVAEIEAEEHEWRNSPVWTVALTGRGRLRLARGETAAALEDFLAWGELSPIPNPAVYSNWRSWAAVALAKLGDAERAEQLAAEELEAARRFGAPRPIGGALRALGLARRGDAAVATLAEAVAVLIESPARLDLCRARIDLGAALRRIGRATDARKELREGLAMAESFGAALLAARATEELDAAGARPRRRELAGVGSLTPSELRVARMAAAGLTNREIAEDLFVTKKAIQFHLGNIYRKLEVPSRADLAEIDLDQ